MRLPVTLMILIVSFGFVTGCSIAERYGETRDMPYLRAKALKYGKWGIFFMIVCVVIQYLHFQFHQGAAY